MPMPLEPVPAPQPRGLRYGLLTVANGPLELPEPGRISGVSYDPVSCGRAHTWPHVEESPGEKVFDARPDTVEAHSFTVYGSLNTGSLGTSQTDLRAELLRNLASGEQTQVEAELAAQLATDGIALGQAASVLEAVSHLEQWVYGTNDYGHVAYLHASPGVAALAADAGLVVQDGPLKRTPFGTLWSIGGGYHPGLMWVTGQVTVWRSSEPFVPPLDQVLNRTTNQYNLIAEREYAVAWDCAAAGVSVDIPGGSP